MAMVPNSDTMVPNSVGGGIPGGISGDIQFNNAGVLGGETLVPLAHGGTNADLSATGGASRVLKQTAPGGNVSVAQLAFSDISGTLATATQLDSSSVTYGTTAVNLGASSTSIAGLTSLSLTSGSTFDINSDTYLGRAAAANLMQGQADAASPVSQTFSVQNVVAGTSNISGVVRNYDGSQGTGTGVGGGHQFRVAPAGGAGNAQNPLVNSLFLSATVPVSAALNSVPQISIGTQSPSSAALVTISCNATTPPAAIAGSMFTLVSKDAAASIFSWDAFGGSPSFVFRRAGGTNATPAATENAGIMGQIQARGFDTAYTVSRASISFVTSQLWAAGANGNQIDFSATANSTTTTNVKWRMQNDGSLSVGNANIGTTGGDGTLVGGFSKWVQGDTVVTTQFDKTNDAVLASITGLTATLVAATKYGFRVILHVTADIVGGWKTAMGGSATATTFISQTQAISDTSNSLTVSARDTTFGNSQSAAADTSYYVTIEGYILVANAGTFVVQFAQKTATPATTSSILVGSTLRVWQL